MRRSLVFRFIKGRGNDAYRAEVLRQLDEDREKFIVKIGDSGREEIFQYNELLQEMERQKDPGNEEIHIFKDIIDHRRRSNRNEIKVLWEDDTETWEPLSVFAKSDPVTCAMYATKNDILHLDGWKRFRRTLPKGNRMLRMFRHIMKLQSKSPNYQFGVRVPKHYSEAMAFDKANGNTLWYDAIQRELDQIREYETFMIHNGKAPPEGYQFFTRALCFCSQTRSTQKSQVGGWRTHDRSTK